jgi:hypothetical protein
MQQRRHDYKLAQFAPGQICLGGGPLHGPSTVALCPALSWWRLMRRVRLCSCCAGSATVCSDWKTRNAQQPGGGVFTNWCKFPGQICTANGTLLRLDMRGFNLQCPFPATDMAVFTSLTTLNLGRNPNMTVSAPRECLRAVGSEFTCIRASFEGLWAVIDAGLHVSYLSLSTPGLKGKACISEAYECVITS